jgi:hypothetical protein
MKSSMATRKLAVEVNAGCRGAGILHLQRPFQEPRKPERIFGIVPDKRLLGFCCPSACKPKIKNHYYEAAPNPGEDEHLG